MDVAVISNTSLETVPATESAVRKALQCFQVLVSPIKTITSLKENPRHFVPLLIAAAYCTVLSSWIVRQVGLRNIIEKTVNMTASVDADATLANLLRYETQIFWTQAISSFVGTLVTAYVIGLVLWLIVTIVGEDIRLKAINSVLAHATLFLTVIKYTLFGMAVALSRNPAGVNIKNPLATNLAFFFHPQSHMLQHVARSCDVLTLMTVALVIIGLRSLSSRRSALASSLVVLIPWVVFVIAGGFLGSRL